MSVHVYNLGPGGAKTRCYTPCESPCRTLLLAAAAAQAQAGMLAERERKKMMLLRVDLRPSARQSKEAAAAQAAAALVWPEGTRKPRWVVLCV